MGTNDSGQAVQSGDLLGTLWTHKRKGGVYKLTQTAPKRGDVYLESQTKGRRSTWKAECLLRWDYEQVPNNAVRVK